MKILFIYIYGKTPQLPIGISYISALLKSHGHQTKLGYLLCNDDLPRLLSLINTWQPQIIGFASMSSTFSQVKTISQKIKDRFPDVFIICGGIHPTLVPECLGESPALDAICRGEGEYPMLELVEKISQGKDFWNLKNFWFKKNGQFIKNELRSLIQNLDELSIPDHDIYLSEDLPGRIHGRGEFIFARGCPFNCNYCSNHALKNLYKGQRYVRYPSVEKAINELLLVTSKYDMNYVIVHDDTFTLNKNWFHDFCSEYKEKVKLPFLCNVRPGTCSKEMFKALKEAGCESVAIGLESGNDFIRKKILNRGIKNEQIIDAFEMAHKAGLHTNSFIMLGLPYENPKRLVDTINLAAKIGNNNTIWHGIFYPYPETNLAQLCEWEGWVEKRDLGLIRERSDTILRLPNLDKKHILSYYNNFSTLVELKKRVINGSHSFDRLLSSLVVYPQLLPLIRLYDIVRRIPSMGFSEFIHKSINKLSKKPKVLST